MRRLSAVLVSLVLGADGFTTPAGMLYLRARGHGDRHGPLGFENDSGNSGAWPVNGVRVAESF
jgi:hypothetical protein